MRLRQGVWVIAISFALGARVHAQRVQPVSGNFFVNKGSAVSQALALQDKTDKNAPPLPPITPLPAQPPAAPPEPLEADAFAQAPTESGEAPTGLNPRMIGDFPGTFVLRTITVPTTQTTTIFRATQVQTGVDSVGKPTFITIQVPVATFQTPTTVNTFTRVPVGSSAIGFKVGENQSPQPEDRAYFSYNFFGNLRGPGGPFASPTANTQSTTLGTDTTNVTTTIPGVSPLSANLHGELLGFEKTILDGRASVGVRVPLFQQQGDGSFNQAGFGDLGVLFNYAFYLDRITGNTLSAGMMVTAPTGPSVDTTLGNIHSTVLQPFLGYRFGGDRFYLLGFSSLAVPTDSRDVTLLFTDIGVGFWAYRGSPERFISAVIPTVETHVTTPLNHRSLADPVSGFDIVDVTGGVQFGIFGRSMLTLGVCTAVTGPRPFNVEAVAQFNFRF